MVGAMPGEEPSRETAPRATCPVCAGTRVGAASLADRFVYLRCADCGEVWSIIERRSLPRTTVSSELR
jgi:hypothetical protein